jgi:hypothetical protein
MDQTCMTSEVKDISLSMLRLWGPSAAQVARGYAQQHEDLGDRNAAQHWHRITLTVAQIRASFGYDAEEPAA